jgi:O-antigen/teichoic acid export membrane protein
MNVRADSTVRNAGLLVILRVLAVASGFIYAALVPRAMGPQVYGQFALITGLSVWFEVASGLGITQVISRETAPLALRDDRRGLQALFGSLLSLRLAAGTVATLGFFLLTRLWLQDIGTLALAAVALTVVVQGVGATLYAFFLGLNRAARWGANDVLSRMIPLLFLLPGYWLGGLTGACLGLLVGEMVVVGVAAVWARPYLSWQGLRTRWDGLRPYLRFALGFYVGSMLTSLFQRSGEPLIRVFHGDYAQVAFFGIAYSGFTVTEGLIPQLTLSFAPFLISLLGGDERERVSRWAGRLLQWIGIAAALAVGGAFLIAADVVEFVFGPEFAPVGIVLVPLALTLVPQGLGAVSRLIAVVFDRPGEAARASLLRLVLLWAAGPFLASRLGGLGASLAVLAAVTGYAAYFGWRMRRVANFPLARWVLTLVAGLLFVPLLPLRGSAALNIALFALFAAAYAGVLFAFRLVSRAEVESAFQILRLRRRPAEALPLDPP